MRRALLAGVLLALAGPAAAQHDMLNGFLLGPEPTRESHQQDAGVREQLTERDWILVTTLPTGRIYDNLPKAQRAQYRERCRNLVQVYWKRGVMDDVIRAFEASNDPSIFAPKVSRDPCAINNDSCKPRPESDPEVVVEEKQLNEILQSTEPGERLIPLSHEEHLTFQERLKAPHVGAGQERLGFAATDPEVIRKRLERHYRWGAFKDQEHWKTKLAGLVEGFQKLNAPSRTIMARLSHYQKRTVDKLEQAPPGMMFSKAQEIYHAVHTSSGKSPRIDDAIALIVAGEMLAAHIAGNEQPSSQSMGRNQMSGLALTIAGAAAAYVDAPSPMNLVKLGGAGVIGTPLLLDTSGDGRPDVHDRAVPGAVVAFDLDADGIAEPVAWVTGGDSLLARDRDGDGRITSGRELFGWAGGHEDGFAALAAECDVNGDGRISGEERTGLLLWRDDGDGLTQPGELTRVSDAGIDWIDCRHRDLVSRYSARGRTRAIWDWLPEVLPPGAD